MSSAISDNYAILRPTKPGVKTYMQSFVYRSGFSELQMVLAEKSRCVTRFLYY
jgi:hypothetical protein